MRTLIIGGGLSGLALAEKLEEQGQDYMLLEARSRFGGRIHSEQYDDSFFDLGPAWFWHGQPRIARLIQKLELDVFDQYAAGMLTYEDGVNPVQRGRGFSSMEGSLRLNGGLRTLIQALADRLPDSRKRLNSKVTIITRTGSDITVELESGEVTTAQHVVLALPPRIAAEINFTPALPTELLSKLRNVPTWMAGQAKAVALYETPFWRDAGLSGDAMSRVGPMVEIHDASPKDGGPYALFGFVGERPEHRVDAEALKGRVVAQMVRLFGEKAGDPLEVYIKDWAADPLTAVEHDSLPMHEHPTYSPLNGFSDTFDGAIQLGGTEVAPQFGGFLEGALEAADISYAKIQKTKGKALVCGKG